MSALLGGISLALEAGMQVQQALIMVLTPPLPLGQVVFTLSFALIAGAFNLRAAHNMAEAVRRSLESPSHAISK